MYLYKYEIFINNFILNLLNYYQKFQVHTPFISRECRMILTIIATSLLVEPLIVLSNTTFEFC